MARKGAKRKRARLGSKPKTQVRSGPRRRDGFALTHELKAELLGYLGETMPRKYAAAHCGIAESTLRSWMSKGRANLRALDDAADGGEPVDLDEYGLLALEVTGVEARARAKILGHVLKAAKDKEQWRAATWLLERLDNPEFGGGAKLSLVAEDAQGEPVDATSLLLDKLSQAEARIAAAVERGEPDGGSE